MAATNALVTGGAGFIGSHLVDALLADGATVTVLDDLSAGSRANLAPSGHERLRLVEGSILDRSVVDQAIAGADVVFHLATQCVRLSIDEPELVHHVNATGALTLLSAAVAARAGRFVYVSSSEVYGSARTVPMREDHPFDPTTVYGASKLAGELYTNAFNRAHRLSTVIVRPFNTYGPRAHFEGVHGELIPKFVLRALAGRSPVIYGDGEQTRDFTYVDDTVRGILLAAGSSMNGTAVNVARGQEVSVNEIARLVIDACGGGVRPEHRGDRPADVRRHLADVSLARRELRFDAAVDIAAGIARYVSWFRQAYPNPERLLDLDQTGAWANPRASAAS